MRQCKEYGSIVAWMYFKILPNEGTSQNNQSCLQEGMTCLEIKKI